MSELSVVTVAVAPAADRAVRPAPELTAVVPVFNRRADIAIVVGRLSRVLASCDWEVIFVDDNSADGSAAVGRIVVDENDLPVAGREYAGEPTYHDRNIRSPVEDRHDRGELRRRPHCAVRRRRDRHGHNAKLAHGRHLTPMPGQTQYSQCRFATPGA